MQLRKSERKQAKMKLALQGPSGSGKTFTAIKLSLGLCEGDLSKVAIIDSENGSSDLYSHLGNYNILPLEPLYSPERYIEAIEACERAGMKVIIIDSISHCWEYLLDVHANIPGNSYTAWAKITPRQKAFIDKILQSPTHIICTMRSKQDYVLSEKNGKMVPEKVGLKAQQRDGVEYEFTIVFDLDMKHYCSASKDRTGMFMGKPEFIINETIGTRILNWCNAPVQNQSAIKELTTQNFSQNGTHRLQ